MSKWQPKTFRAQYVQIVRLHWSGYTNAEIGTFLNFSDVHVSNILNSDEAQQMLAKLKEHTISSLEEVQDEFQLIAPLAAREKIRLALEATDERVRNIACSDILNMAGHAPVKRIQLERGQGVEEDLAKLSDDELRKKIRDEVHGRGLGGVGTPAGSGGTPVDRGPDGKLVN